LADIIPDIKSKFEISKAGQARPITEALYDFTLELTSPYSVANILSKHIT